MTELPAIAPVLVALSTGIFTLLARSWPRLQRVVVVAGTLGYAGVVGALSWDVVFASDGARIVYQVGGWRAPFGITLVADGLSVFMLAMTAVVAVYAAVFSVRFIDEHNQQVYYYPLFQFLLLGATGAFLTGDLFNLFVWFEVMLMTSYVFVAFYGNAIHTASAMRYLVLNIVGSALMLLGVGGLYATTGTLNMADMARMLAAGGVAMRPVVGVSALVFVTFALKAGLVPFQFWVPGAYRAAPLPVVAMFVGVTKKVGIYAIIRLYFTVFGTASVPTDVPGVAGDTPLAFLAPVLLVMAVASIVVGGFGALGRDSLEGLFAYSSIGQIGFIAVPIGIAAATASETLRKTGLLAGLIFALHHALTKGLLFLATGVIRDTAGTTQLSELGGLGERSPGFASVFLVGSLSLVGIPPLAGFFGKFLVFDTAGRQFATQTAGGFWAVTGASCLLAVLLVGALLTILYSTRAWMGAVWGDQTEPVQTSTVDAGEVAILATLSVIVVAVGVGFEPVYEFAEAAAESALDTDGYVDAVLGGADE
ncbi:multicomponent Na+:H+ antiporter subunit D [Halovenus aranensis]|uniref:Multicomponent Na+:H+ antiporter subunit D n=1 Tax=Halovenus aranensis TaxID=890420 RepID=A0A1G8U2T8_9EURY|nr:proton-conducting transporter membrane subunit [Halovenus aranensis]SDJ48019.1 multicomponent Na+:H+ antiporter subunit D [Halovenus aranensis]